MGDDFETNSGKLYLERAEDALFTNFIADINSGEYDRAGQLLGYMERLSLV